MTLESTAAVEPKLLYEEDSTLLTTNIEIVVLTGSADDPAGKTGATSMLGDLVLRGTKKKSRSKFQSELERLGGSLGVTTTQDATYFSGKVIRENTMAFLKLVQEALVEPGFNKKEFDSLKTEVLGGIAYRKTQNTRLAGLELRREIFAGTPLERPADGSMKSVEAIKLEDLVKTYNNRFHRGNFIFSIASPLKEADLKKSVSDLWLKFPDGAKLSRRSYPLQIPKSPTLVVINKPNTSTGSIFFGQAGITAQDPDRYALNVGNFTFGGEPLVSRLFLIIREQLGWTYAIYSTYGATGSLADQQGLFSMISTPSVEFTGKVILKSLSMWQDFLKSGLKSEEIKLSQESLVNSYPFKFDSAEKRLGQKLYSFMYGTPVLSPEEFSKTIFGIGNDKIESAFAERHNANGWLICIVADAKVVEKQLAEEQKSVPENQRLKIAKVITPEEVIQ